MSGWEKTVALTMAVVVLVLVVVVSVVVVESSVWFETFLVSLVLPISFCAVMPFEQSCLLDYPHLR